MYFSATLLYRVIVDTPRPRRRHLCDETVIVFRARDYDAAFARALVLGRARETTYRNGDGQRVRWLLAEIRTLDQIGATLDGAQVLGGLRHEMADQPLGPRTRFRPEQSKPVQTGAAGSLPKRAIGRAAV
jgi:hypothetical protein